MQDTDQAIEIILNTKTREILEEVHRSDIGAGEEFDGILAHIYESLGC